VHTWMVSGCHCPCPSGELYLDEILRSSEGSMRSPYSTKTPRFITLREIGPSPGPPRYLRGMEGNPAPNPHGVQHEIFQRGDE